MLFPNSTWHESLTDFPGKGEEMSALCASTCGVTKQTIKLTFLLTYLDLLSHFHQDMILLKVT